METGKLAVHTENILPIIKKWLYSEKEIFLRELVSNAFDATGKLRRIALTEEVRDAEDSEYYIDIQIDRENNTLTFEDNGIGMTADEIRKYIAQIAFSGAEEFLKQYEGAEKQEGQSKGVIGHFGLGFYSSFMVAERVEIQTLSYRPDAEPAYWSSEGDESYQIGAGNRTRRGTSITLHVEPESRNLLDKTEIQNLVRRYCDFLNIPIKVDGTQVNRQKPLWTEQPSQLKREDYNDFYQYLYPFQGEPLFYVHLNVDYPFRLQGVLFFPRLAHEMDLNKSEVKIYCQQVFVTGEAQELIPKYLTILQGVIDIPDLPLNVSRSYLQNEPQIRKIAQHVIKKVADRLNEEFKNNRARFEEMWPDVAPFIKYAALSDEKFYDQIKDSLLFQLAGEDNAKSGEDDADAGEAAEGAGKSGGRFVTVEEYRERNKDKIGDKIFYATDPRMQAGPIQLLRDEGVDVALLNTMIDSHFAQYLEGKLEGVRFVRVDAELADHVVDKAGTSKLTDAEGNDLEGRLTELFQKAIGNAKVTIRVEALKNASIPAMALFAEHTRRFGEMAAMMSGGREMPEMPQEHTLLLNSKSEVIRKLAAPEIAVAGEGGASKRELMAKQIYYLARLAQGGVGPKEIDQLLKASYDVLGRAV